MKKATSQYASAAWLTLLLALLCPSIAAGQSVELSEFMTSGGSGVVDEDGDDSDWIEVHNAGSTAIDLEGWGLSDEPAVPLKWQFPSIVLQPDAYLLVFASGKDRRTVGNAWDTVVRASDTWRYTTSTPPANWDESDFNDTSWPTGPGGFGYGDNDDATVVPNGTLTVYVRTRFTINDPSQVSRGLLHVTWDDGFVAYLNGTEIARANCCADPTAGEPGPLAPFNVANVQSLLQPGENVLALEVWNSDGISTDLSLIPYLSLEFTTPPPNPRGVATEVGPLGESSLHTNFSLAQEGEYLAVSRPDGTPVTEFDPYPIQYGGASYGGVAGSFGYYNTPTPGAANGAAGQGVVAPPSFSMDHGFFDAPFKLFLIPETPGSTIRYTTDGSTPSSTHGAVYTEPILIDRTRVVRAIATMPGAINSASITQSYIFPNDVIRQSATGNPPSGWPARWGTNDTDYGMDPDVVNGRENEVIESLLALPSFSIVTDLKNLFDEETGIYSNALGYGREWERPTSVELIHPDGTDGFQINAGIRIRGGYSRNDPNPKHAFRFYFRNDYGAGKLVYPLFGDEGVDEFDVIDLRTSQNYSWSYGGDGRNTMVRDVWARDTQREMGVPYTRSRYYHLYVNGQYWGVFQTQERAEASYGESYLGGDKEEYDVIKSAGLANNYQVEATDGDFTAWRALYDGVNVIPQLSTEAARTEQYMRLQGKNPDGTRNPAYEVLLDADNLINYMLVIFYTGNFDAPISGFLGNNATNNFFSMRRRGSDRGFVHFAHDNEHTLLPEDDRYETRLGPFPAGSQFNFSNPQWLHQQLMASAEYRLRFADLAQKHLFNSGTLTTQKAIERLDRRAAEVKPGLLAESARWGDSKRSTAYGLVDWEREITRLRTQILPPRNAQIVEQLRQARRYTSGMPGATILAPLFPSVAAPALNTEGGEIPANFGLQITASTGTIYYTLDGSDPRLIGGGVSGTASTYSGTITLSQPTVVNARVRTSGGEWSPLMSGSFLPGSVAPAQNRVAITEINYHPVDPTPEEVSAGFTEDASFEFVEVTNLTNSPLDLTGMRFDEGIDFTFGPGTLNSGNRIVVVSNRDAFVARYGSLPIAGVYSGQLSNGGEQIRLVSADGEVLSDVTYSDDRPWPARADGGGSSLELIDHHRPVDDVSNWRASANYLGTPGGVGATTGPGVVINEVLSNTEEPLVDAIELHNTTGESVDVSGWYISDSGDYRKFRIPDGTVIEPGGYVVFEEGDFNARGDTTGFSLNGGRAESLWLVSTSGDELVMFSDEVHFPAMGLGESIGRWPNGSGEMYPMTAPSLGADNPGPRVGPVVISEIMYEPPGNNVNLEYIQIYNAGSESEDLTNWRLGEGVEFVFPAGTSLPAGGSLVVVSFVPSENQEKYRAFRQSYGYLGASPVVGGWTGRLDNDGEPIVLFRAGEAPANNPTNVPLLLEDRVTYRSEAPWPTEPAGQGSALRRIDPFGFPGDPANWTADRKSISIDDTPPLPIKAFALDAPYPNPAHEAATLTLSLGTAQRVRVELYDVLGRRVLQLHDGVLEGGRVHRFEMQFDGFASGLYLIRAVGEKTQDSASVTVVR